MVSENILEKRIFSRLGLLLIGVIFSICLVYAAVLVTTVTGVNSFNITAQSLNSTSPVAYTFFNITFNSSVFPDQNLSRINITIPSSFTMNHTFTNASFDNNYTTTATTISFINATGNYFNATNISLWLNVSASVAGNFNITITWTNGSMSNSTNINVYVNDTLFPTSIASTSIATQVVAASGFYKGSRILNFTITEDLPSYVMFNITNSTGQQNVTLRASQQGSGSYWNATLDTTTLPNGNYSLNVWVNDTVMSNWNDQSMLNNTYWIRNFTIDNTNPAVSVSASNATSTTIGLTLTVSDGYGIASGCSATRSVSIAGSTSPTMTGTGGTQYLVDTGLSCGSSYTYTITCGDQAGNQVSTTTSSYSTSSCGAGVVSSGGSSSATVATTQKVYTWSQITPGVAKILKDFNKELGVKEISIEVNNEANNVKIDVVKYAGKPAEVTKEKSGKVYQYMHINSKNLEGKLSKGKITIKVPKTWLTENGISKENVILSRFNPTAGEWNELVTSYSNGDAEFEYYVAETPEFSYFAISEKVVVQPETSQEGEVVEEKIPEVIKSNYLWLWVLIGIVAVVIAVRYFWSMKK